MPELGQRAGGRLAQLPPLEHAAAHRLHAEADVLHDGEVRRERELLMDHRHAGRSRVDRLTRRVGHTLEPHRAGVGLDRARQDRHERALAGAVLPDERAHLPGGDCEVDAVDRHGGAKHLAHAAHLEARRAGRHGVPRDRSGCNRA
jgi:hypothetical protein